MPMIKRAKSGQIDEMVDKKTATPTRVSLAWSDEQETKDSVLLEVPTTKEYNIDVDLDEDDPDSIAVRI
jgi:hypothetical protein